MKVYEYKGAPNPARVRIALAEKGLFDAVEFVQVDLPGGAHRQPAFLAKNPSGALPVLELDDGTCISECTAITEFLDQSAGEPELTGRTARERALIHMMQRKVESGLMEALAAYFHQATPGLGPALEGEQNKAWGERQLGVARATLRWLDGVLAERPYLAGERFTVADITLMGALHFARLAGQSLPPELANVQAWHNRVQARPSAALAA